MAIKLTKGTEVEWRAYIHERIKEVKENMSIKYGHESNLKCRDWWDSIEPEDFYEIAYIELGCVCITANIDFRSDAGKRECPEISYYLSTKSNDETEEGFWESFEYIIPNHLDKFSKFTTWGDIFNDMLWELIEYCIEYEIDYEADHFLIHTDICDELKDKLNAEFSAFIKTISDREEAIQCHYKITMMHEFRIALNEMAENMTNRDIRKRFIEEPNILEQLYNAFLKRDTGEMETYKEIINEEMKGGVC